MAAVSMGRGRKSGSSESGSYNNNQGNPTPIQAKKPRGRPPKHQTLNKRSSPVKRFRVSSGEVSPRTERLSRDLSPSRETRYQKAKRRARTSDLGAGKGNYTRLIPVMEDSHVSEEGEDVSVGCDSWTSNSEDKAVPTKKALPPPVKVDPHTDLSPSLKLMI